MCFTADMSKPWTGPGPTLPEEQSMETVLTATRCWVSLRRLMLHIKQTKEIANLIVSHSLAQPNISKSDSLSLLQSKTLYNQISLHLFYELGSGKVSLSLSIWLKEIFICHFKSSLVWVWSAYCWAVHHMLCLVPCFMTILELFQALSVLWVVTDCCALTCPAVVFCAKGMCVPSDMFDRPDCCRALKVWRGFVNEHEK